MVVICLFKVAFNILCATFNAVITYHFFSSSFSGTTSTTGCSISVVVITPSGVGVIVSPLAIVLGLGLPKSFLFLRFFFCIVHKIKAY